LLSYFFEAFVTLVFSFSAFVRARVLIYGMGWVGLALWTAKTSGGIAALLLAFSGFGVALGADVDALVGSWTWSWKDGQGVTHNHVLEVEGAGEKVAAQETFDEEKPVKVTDLKVSGQKVSFSVLRDKRQATYTGTLKGKDLIDGMVTVSNEGQPNEFGWQAKKQADKK